MRPEKSKSDFNGLPFSEKDIRRVLGSSAGQQLLQILTQSGGNELQWAAEELKRGNIDAAKEILSPVMNSPQASTLVDEINGTTQNGRN